MLNFKRKTTIFYNFSQKTRRNLCSEGEIAQRSLGPEHVFTLCNMFSSLFLGHFVSHSSEAAVRRSLKAPKENQ